MIKPVTFGTQ